MFIPALIFSITVLVICVKMYERAEEKLIAYDGENDLHHDFLLIEMMGWSIARYIAPTCVFLLIVLAI